MAKISSVKYTAPGVQLALLILRIGAGLMIINHGLPKIAHFSQLAPHFANPLYIGTYASLVLVLFAEIVCGILLVFGLFTRWASIPLIIEMLVLVFLVHHAHGFSEQELAVHFLIAFIVILILGPGKISLDGLISR
jgi:putative oxidoreductase